MFDDNSLRDLQAKMQAAYQATVEQIDKKLTAAFSALPDKLQKAFDTKNVKNFRENVRDIASDFKKMEKSADEIQKKNEILYDLAEKLQKTIKEQIENLGKQNEEEQKLIKALMSKARTTEDLLDAQEYSFELNEKTRKQQTDLLELSKQINTVSEVAKAKKAQYIALQEQQYRNEQMNIVSSNVFGVSLEKIRDKSNYIKKLWLDTSIWTKIAIGVGLIGKQLIDGFTNARAAGNDAGQSLGSSWSAALASLGGLSRGIFAGVGTSAANQGALQNILGTTAIPTELTEQANRLTTQYGISAGEAAHLIGYLQRANHFQTKTTENALIQARTMAHIAGIPVGTVMHDLASSTNEWAMYANRGVVAFERAVIATRQAGINVDTMGRVMDRFTDDFSDALDAQARLQTVLPGLDLTRFQYASQFGTIDQAQAELRNAFKNVGISNISQIRGRSIQNQVLRGVGLSAEDLNNILNPTPTTPEKKGLLSNDTVESFANSILGFVTGLSGASIALAAFTGATVAATLAQGVKGIGGGIGALVGGATKLATGGVGSLVGGATRLAAGGASLISGLALPTAEVVGSYSVMKSIADKASPEERLKYSLMSAMPGGAMLPMVTDAAIKEAKNMSSVVGKAGTQAENAIVLDTKALEEKLETVIKTLKNMKINVELDGKRVGNGILEAYSH